MDTTEKLDLTPIDLESATSEHLAKLPPATVAEIAALKECPEALEYAQLVGRWVWITFPEKPSAQCRSFLKSRKYRWNTQRNAWQNSCGFYVRRAPYDPRIKYGTEKVVEVLKYES